mmetsp:Transcript_2478/g.4761  ORF Transcript_2478/g.4761 Transcript_2478/m.4761 type:complete len:85 (-) Transcript_2478:1393-1647(-)
MYFEVIYRLDVHILVLTSIFSITSVRLINEKYGFLATKLIQREFLKHENFSIFKDYPCVVLTLQERFFFCLKLPILVVSFLTEL